MIDTDKLQGDVRILALAVQALIETHTDKAAVHKALKDLIDNPEKSSLYSPVPVTERSITLVQDLFRTAHSKAELPREENINPSQSS